jgi:hypothetical protein
MEPGGETDEAMSQAGLGEGLRDHGFDVFFALGTVIPVNRVFSDFGLDIVGDDLLAVLPRSV